MFKLRRPDDLEEVSVTVSTETFVRLAVMTVIIVVLVFSAIKVEHALILILVSFFLALALNAPVYRLSRLLPGKRKGSRAIATSISYLVIVLIIGGFAAIIVPPLVHQTDNLIKAAPHLVKEFREQNSPIGKFIRAHHLQGQVNDVSTQLSNRLQHISGTAFSTFKRVTDSIFSVVSILVLTFMMLVEGPRWARFFADVVPDKHHDMAARLARDMYKVIRGYVNGQVVLAFLAAALIMPAVLLLHIGYPVGIMVIIFICGLVPLVGHTIGAVIVTAIALIHSTSAAIIILAYYLLYMQIEAYIISPKIQANATNMSPLLVFMSLLIGLSFGGIVGGLIAIPIAGCLRIALLEYLYSKHIIGGHRLKEAITPDTK